MISSLCGEITPCKIMSLFGSFSISMPVVVPKLKGRIHQRWSKADREST